MRLSLWMMWMQLKTQITEMVKLEITYSSSVARSHSCVICV